MKKFLRILCILIVLVIVGRVAGKIIHNLDLARHTVISQTWTTWNKTTENIGIANPASVYCENNWWTLLIEESTWGQIGMCTFPDGRTCEERAYMRHECTFDDPASMCTMEYAPVCASVAIQCIKAPCDPVEQTFWNRCQMNANTLATFLHEWECAAK